MREEVVALEDDADLLAQLAQVGRGVVDRLAVEHDPSALDRLEPVDAAQHGALARARAADDGDDLAGLDRERDAVEHGVGAEALDHVVELNERHGASVPGAGSTASAGSIWRNRSRRRRCKR